MRRRRVSSLIRRVLDVDPVVLAATAIAAAAAAAYWGCCFGTREFFSSSNDQWVIPAQPLVVTHVRQSTSVHLRVDHARGPSPLSADVEDRLSLLLDRHGLRIVDSTAGADAPLRITDAAEMAQYAKIDEEPDGIVAPLPGKESRRALFLISPIPSEGRKGARIDDGPSSLIQAAKEQSAVRVVACCASDLEATLFGLAWAAAGGGDVSSSNNVSVRVFPSIDEATDAAIESSRPSVFAIVAIWCAAGSPALRSATARIRASPSGAGRGDASWRHVPYHPSDVADADGRAFEEAPHQLHARAPSLRFEPVELVGGGGGGKDKNKKSMTLMCAPTIVVLASSSNNDASANAMAGLIAEALMYDDLISVAARVPVDSSAAAECAALEAHGGRLHERTTELVRAASKRGLAVTLATPYGRSVVPIMEQFADGNDDAEVPTGGSDALGSSTLVAGGAIDGGDDVRGWDPQIQPQQQQQKHSSGDRPLESAANRHREGGAIELAPVRGLTAEDDGVTFRTIWYDEAGSGRGAIEATFAPDHANVLHGHGHGHAHVDGVRLRRGDRVVLTVQERAIEQNGTYIVIDDRTMQSPVVIPAPSSPYRTSLVPPPVPGKGGEWNWRFSGVSDGGLGLRVGDDVAWLAIPGAPVGRVVGVARDGTIAIEIPSKAVVASPSAAKFDRDWLHPLATCSADPKTPTRQLCESEHPGAVWDRPCQRDADCPFASSSTSHASYAAYAPHYRGRCLSSGRCEVPVGAELVGWRHVAAHLSKGMKPICACPRSSSDPLSIEAASEACCEKRGAVDVYDLDRV